MAHAQAKGVQLEARHYNPYLRVLGRWPNDAQQQLALITNGHYGAPSRPNADTYNALIEVRSPHAELFSPPGHCLSCFRGQEKACAEHSPVDTKCYSS